MPVPIEVDAREIVRRLLPDAVPAPLDAIDRQRHRSARPHAPVRQLVFEDFHADPPDGDILHGGLAAIAGRHAHRGIFRIFRFLEGEISRRRHDAVRVIRLDDIPVNRDFHARPVRENRLRGKLPAADIEQIDDIGPVDLEPRGDDAVNDADRPRGRIGRIPEIAFAAHRHVARRARDRNQGVVPLNSRRCPRDDRPGHPVPHGRFRPVRERKLRRQRRRDGNLVGRADGKRHRRRIAAGPLATRRVQVGFRTLLTVAAQDCKAPVVFRPAVLQLPDSRIERPPVRHTFPVRKAEVAGGLRVCVKQDKVRGESGSLAFKIALQVQAAAARVIPQQHHQYLPLAQGGALSGDGIRVDDERRGVRNDKVDRTGQIVRQRLRPVRRICRNAGPCRRRLFRPAARTRPRSRERFYARAPVAVLVGLHGPAADADVDIGRAFARFCRHPSVYRQRIRRRPDHGHDSRQHRVVVHVRQGVPSVRRTAPAHEDARVGRCIGIFAVADGQNGVSAVVGALDGQNHRRAGTDLGIDQLLVAIGRTRLDAAGVDETVLCPQDVGQRRNAGTGTVVCVRHAQTHAHVIYGPVGNVPLGGRKGTVGGVLFWQNRPVVIDAHRRQIGAYAVNRAFVRRLRRGSDVEELQESRPGRGHAPGRIVVRRVGRELVPVC